MTGDPRSHNNLGVALAQGGETAAAVVHFKRALSLDPTYARAHLNLGSALLELGRREDARKELERAVAASPGMYQAHRHLGFIYANSDRYDAAMHHFSRTLQLDRGTNRSDQPNSSRQFTTRAKLAHDIRQFQLLARRGVRTRDFTLLAQEYEDLLHSLAWTGDSSALMRLPAPLPLPIEQHYNTVLHMAEAPRVEGGPINPDLNAAEITRRFLRSDNAVAWFDDFLCQEALQSLARFAEESTIWFDFQHMPGHLASYLENGLATPLLLQIAGQARRVFPEIIGTHELKQVWAFKNIDPDARIAPHADDAAISLNFWVAPDTGGSALRESGMRVHIERFPPEKELTSHTHDAATLRQALRGSPASFVDVPYRQNRAVLFESSRYHESLGARFSDSEISHRVNITMLFGERSSSVT